MNKQVFVAVTGLKHYFGSEFIQIGQVVRLVKEPSNPQDQEAILVEMTPLGKIGYVANSTHTVPKGCHSAGRVYDTFEDYVSGYVRFIVKDTLIVEVAPHLKEVYLVMNLEEQSLFSKER